MCTLLSSVTLETVGVKETCTVAVVHRVQLVAAVVNPMLCRGKTYLSGFTEGRIRLILFVRIHLLQFIC